jgi:putative membrane protein
MMISGFCDVGAWGSWGDFGGWGWIGPILGLVFWLGVTGGLTLLFVWFVRRTRVRSAPAAPGGGQPPAREILQTRYAKGEITREQYQLMKQDTGGGNVSETQRGDSK